MRDGGWLMRWADTGRTRNISHRALAIGHQPSPHRRRKITAMSRPEPSASDLSHLIPRRELLRLSGLGFGTVAATYLLHSEGLGAATTDATGTRTQPGRQPDVMDLRARPGHFPPRARAVIQLMQNGGPSQMELFD